MARGVGIAGTAAALLVAAAAVATARGRPRSSRPASCSSGRRSGRPTRRRSSRHATACWRRGSGARRKDTRTSASGCRETTEPAGPRRPRWRAAFSPTARGTPAGTPCSSSRRAGRWCSSTRSGPARASGGASRARPPTRGGRGRTRSGCRPASSARSAPSRSSWRAASCWPGRAASTPAGWCTWSAGPAATWHRPTRGGRAGRSTTRRSSARSSRRSSRTRPPACRCSAAAVRGSSPRPGPRMPASPGAGWPQRSCRTRAPASTRCGCRTAASCSSTTRRRAAVTGSRSRSRPTGRPGAAPSSWRTRRASTPTPR